MVLKIFVPKLNSEFNEHTYNQQMGEAKQVLAKNYVVCVLGTVGHGKSTLLKGLGATQAVPGDHHCSVTNSIEMHLCDVPGILILDTPGLGDA